VLPCYQWLGRADRVRLVLELQHRSCSCAASAGAPAQAATCRLVVARSYSASQARQARTPTYSSPRSGKKLQRLASAARQDTHLPVARSLRGPVVADSLASAMRQLASWPSGGG
jgi:hypothetical protein